MLASGVCRLCDTPRRKSSLAASSSISRWFCASTRANSWALRMATAISNANSSSRSWSARSQRRVAGRRPRIRPSGSPPIRSSARIGRGSPGTGTSPGMSSGSTSKTTESISPNAARASRAARRTSCSMPSRGDASSIASRTRPSSRLRRSRSDASRLWLSARRAMSSSPVTSIGVERSPAEARSTARAMARRGAVRSDASAYAIRTANTNALAIANSSVWPIGMSVGRAGGAVTSATIPNPARGSTAAARSAAASRARNDQRELRPLSGATAARLPAATSAGGGTAPGAPIAHALAPESSLPASGSRLRWASMSARGGPVGRRGIGPRDQAVADPTHGQQVLRLVRVELDLLAQPAHRHPDVRRVGIVGVGPAAEEECLGRHRLAEVRRQRVEQPRFGRRELDDLAADRRFALVELEDEVRPEHQLLSRDLVAEPPEHASDPRAQLRVVVRLRHVVLGDLLQEVRLGVSDVDRRQHDDRQVCLALDLARQRQAVHARHQHVDDQEVRPALTKPTKRLVAVASGHDVEAGGAQLLGEDHQQVRIVVDDEDPGTARRVAGRSTEHGARIAAVSRRSATPGLRYASGWSTSPPAPPVP